MREAGKVSIDYAISHYLLGQVLAKGLITQDEFDHIDKENRKTFEK